MYSYESPAPFQLEIDELKIKEIIGVETPYL